MARGVRPALLLLALWAGGPTAAEAANAAALFVPRGNPAHTRTTRGVQRRGFAAAMAQRGTHAGRAGMSRGSAPTPLSPAAAPDEEYTGPSSRPSWLPLHYSTPGSPFDKRFRMPSQFGGVLSDPEVQKYFARHCRPGGARSRLPPVDNLPGVRARGAYAGHAVGQQRDDTHFANLAPFVKEKRDAGRRDGEELYPDNGQGTAALLEGLDLSSCAVVGNAGVLKLGRNGAEIDRHGTVFRLNQAPTARYERWVGRKTSVRLLNRLWTKGYAQSANGLSHSVLPTEEGVKLVASREFPQEFVALSNRHAKSKRSRAGGVFSMSFDIINKARRVLLTYRECMRRAGKPPSPGGNTPSSGFVAAWYFKEVCDHLNVYGIGTPKGNLPPEAGYQYYSGFASRVAGNPVHSSRPRRPTAGV